MPGPGTCNLWHQRAHSLVGQADLQVDKTNSMYEPTVGCSTEYGVNKGGEGRPRRGFKEDSAAKSAAQPGVIALHPHVTQRSQHYYYPHFMDEETEVQRG